MASIEQNKKKEHLENFLKELGIKSPLRASELNKDDIRTLSKDLGLPTWNKQSFACLSSRFVYGETISEEKLKMVDKAEQLLLDMGYHQVRVRIHGMIARIEILPEEFSKLIADENRNRIVIFQEIKVVTFRFIAFPPSEAKTQKIKRIDHRKCNVRAGK